MLIETPTALLNTSVVKRNIAAMAQKAQQNGVRFRPHFKTHQSATIGEWFRAEGVTAITASSVSMARYFADHGWHDITVAFPVNWREIDAINKEKDWPVKTLRERTFNLEDMFIALLSKNKKEKTLV